ncbi:peptidase inhibitor family I36 protein [Streptomyces sp. MN03-5084-2B]|nr:peptidase inhibitor family I36 protein [Streptomyces sp. MN03-5084-2B]
MSMSAVITSGRAIAIAALACAGAAIAPMTAEAAAAAPASPAAYECTAGYVCFYQGSNGTGRRCQYSQNNPKANEICSWGLVNPKSISNRTTKKVTYYTEQDYDNKIGSTTAGNSGNLAGNYTVRSLKF